ncbi:MAG: acetoacetate--CoA ligase [Actinomycetota bacterium]
MAVSPEPETLWEPAPDAWATTRLGGFAARHRPDLVGDYAGLHQWSVTEPDQFWTAVWDEFDIQSATEPRQVRFGGPMPAVRWFEGATLNYAAHVLRGSGLAADDVAIVCRSQSRPDRSLTMGALREEVGRVASGLRALGVGRGDRVAAFLPNVEETVVAFLATAAIGAVWSSCAPEFGPKAVIDRWSQIEPTVLLTIDGYQHGSKRIELSSTVATIRAGLPSLTATVVLPYLDGAPAIPDAVAWGDLGGPDPAPSFEPVPFDHPLYVLYSSGTTGLPKAIVHGHGGMLLEHAKQLGLHFDLGPGDRFFWFSTTGWMMWNFLVSGLLVGSSIVLFDGDPQHPDLSTLWSLVAETGTTVAGMSAPFIGACRSAGLEPARDFPLGALRAVGSTGAPLPSEGFRWLDRSVGRLPIWSISGGTDVCSAFIGGAPVLPVTVGSMACRQLGWAVDAFGPDGQPVRNRDGELVITAPSPSMPVGLWGDDGSRYRTTYFDRFNGVWHHGDWLTIDDADRCTIRGRSDATLNRGGVRLGTADFYAVVEADDAVADSLVVHLEDADDAGGPGRLVLFVAPAEGAEIDDAVRRRLTAAVRAELSPRHGPDRIVEVPAVPRTLSGKKLEVPVKRILQGVPVEQAAATGALADPSALDPYIAVAKEDHQ